MDQATFLVRFPEFTARTAIVDAALAEATARTDASIFGALTDQAIMWLAAHLVATSPDGTGARLAPEGAVVPGMKAPVGAKSLYLAERERLEDLVGPLQYAGLG